MGSDEIGRIKRLYREPYDFALSVHEDISVFMNMREFGALHEIDGQKVPCVVTGSYLSQMQMNGVMARGMILWIKNDCVARADVGTVIRLDGQVYMIGASRLIQGELWRIELEAGVDTGGG